MTFYNMKFESSLFHNSKKKGNKVLEGGSIYYILSKHLLIFLLKKKSQKCWYILCSWVDRINLVLVFVMTLLYLCKLFVKGIPL
jgi:hypothetical protein